MRKVHFAENDDVFIIPFTGEDSLLLDESSQISHGRLESDVDDDGVSPYANSLVNIRERMRDCIATWLQTPFWKLLDGCVDGVDGEAKDVQKYIITYARIEVDGECPRGLERQLCRSHHEARKKLYEDATRAVLANEFRLRTECARAQANSDEIWKQLRHIYKEHSRGAKAFARKMGKADEAAVQRDPIDTANALEQIEELLERIKNGTLHAKRVLPTAEPRSSRSTSSTLPLSRRSRSLDPMGQDSDHSKKDSQTKKDRKVLPRIPALNMMHSHGKDNECHSKGHITDISENSDILHAADLFHEVDKKGKTKRSSRWKSLKKGISKRVQSGGSSHRTQ